MVIIYSQDETWIKEYPEMCKDLIFNLYGNKLGAEAYGYICNAPVNSTFRKNGGPLIKIVTESEGRIIYEKEKKLGLLSN